MRRFPSLAMFAGAIGRDIRHGAWAIKGDGGHQILKAVRAHLPQAVAHPLPFKLEDAGSITAPEHFIGFQIIQRDGGDIYLNPLPFQDVQRAFNDGECLQAQEVELHQARHLRVFHRILRDQHFRTRVAIQRHGFNQGPAPNHQASGMGGGIAIKPFHLQRDNQKPRDLFVAIAHFLQARFAINGLGQCDGLRRVVRNEGGDLVHLPIRHAEHAPHIAHRGLGLQLAEGDDLRDAILAIFAPDIGNHLVAPVLAEINIEIRHGNAFGVEEAFKQQAEADGVQIRDQQRPGSDGTRARTAPRPYRNGRGLRFRPLDEIGNN